MRFRIRNALIGIGTYLYILIVLAGIGARQATCRLIYAAIG